MEGRPRRSALYMPGSNARAVEKARKIPADALIFDLEDAVAPDAKTLAREQVCAAVKAGGYGVREVVIRVNALGRRRSGCCVRSRARRNPRSQSRSFRRCHLRR